MFTRIKGSLISVINRESLTMLISKNFPLRTIDLKWNSNFITSNIVENKEEVEVHDSHEQAVKKVARLLNEYPDPDSIEWEDVNRKLKELNMRNPSSKILQACLRLQNLKAGINYFDYVVKSGKELTPLELVFFIKLFSSRKDQIVKYESVIKQIYQNIKEYMDSTIVQNYLLDLISESPSCYYDFINNFSKEEFKFAIGKRVLAAKAFELKNPKLAYDMMNKFNININEIVTYYINYVCQMVIENKFSPDMITTFIKFCEDKNYVISSRNFPSDLLTLINTLQEHDKDYVWTLKKCKINHTDICPKCDTKLLEKSITESEFNSLKKAFFPKAGLGDYSTFLTSTVLEKQNFLEFLSKCRPYDIVMDGLNLIYSQSHSKEFSRVLNYFFEKGLKVLIIARVHAKKQIHRQACFQKGVSKGKYQFFFTENLSDDDLFTLYAALHGGIGTKLVSGDFLNKYGARFDEDLQKVFFKWKIKHQYIFSKNKLYPPLPTLGLSQLTTKNDRMYIWHISYISEASDDNAISRSVNLKWICVKAEKKSEVTSE